MAPRGVAFQSFQTLHDVGKHSYTRYLLSTLKKNRGSVKYASAITLHISAHLHSFFLQR